MPHRNQRQITQFLSNNSTTTTTGSLGSLTSGVRGGGSRGFYPGGGIGRGVPFGASAPPLITDTLTACLDANGTYVCTSYSPRCYIIQKVTPTNVTVTPGGGSSSTAGQSSTLHLSPSLSHLYPPRSLQRGPLTSLFPTHLKPNGIPLLPSPRHPPPRPSYLPHPPHPHHLKTPLAKPPGFEKTAAPNSGRVYMNGEIDSWDNQSNIMPAAVVYPTQAAVTAPLPPTHFTEPHLNGVSMSEEPGALANAEERRELTEVDDGIVKRPYDQALADGSHTPDIPVDELKRMLLSQLEYYFSPENLASDKFLVSQMDSDHYVYVSTLANFNMIKKLTADIDLVTEVLRESKQVQVHADGKRVRPVSHRTVVILRGIPESTPVDEIKSLFDSENCPKCTGCEFAFNDSWYISFECDDDAQQAHRYLREDVREFKGQPIMARIKSKPTTLLSQGVGIGVPTINKNGYQQPPGVMQQFMATAPQFVPVSQTGPSNTQAPLYAPGQQVPSVFSLPASYGGFNPWGGFYDINSGGLTPMYPVNGLPQSSSGYPKSNQIGQMRPRNPNAIRTGPRRTMSSSSETQGGGVGAPGNNSNSSNGHSGVPSHQQQQPFSSQPPRKSNNGAPPPLLGMAPQNVPLVSHPPSNHGHHQSHHPTHSSIPTQNTVTSVSSNGRHYNSYPQSVPHNASENYHYTSSNRGYRGGIDSRPRSSLGSRRGGGGPGRREDEGAYDYTSSGPSASSAYRVNPSTRTVPSAASPQMSAQTSVNNQNHQINLDLEGAAFPPLPGSASSSSKNGDSPYEGRLSDVVKGVKSMKVGGGSTEKEELGHLGEIVVSAAEPESAGEVVVSAAHPLKDEETVGKRDADHHSSHPLGSKKEYREIGVGGADENHDIRSSQSSSSIVSGNRQMADKSTRTDENLLNGDQSSGGTNKNSQQGELNYHRKSSSGGVNPSPVPGKRGVPPFQNASVGVGTEVPYSSSRSLASPVSSSPAKPPFVTNSSSSKPNATVPTGPGRGATSSNAKVCADNKSSGTAAAAVGAGAGPVPLSGSLNTSDKEAFPTPSFVKVVPSSTSTKPFSGLTDHVPKEVVKSEEERKEAGQGDGRKLDDCSTEDRDGPVRMSYAQVAQSRKDAIPAVQGQSSVSLPTLSNQQGAPVAITSPNSATTHVPLEDKKRGFKDTKDGRAQQSKSQRVGGDRDRDRDRDANRGFRRNFRSRGSSDISDTGSNSGGSNSRPPRGPRSPK